MNGMRDYLLSVADYDVPETEREIARVEARIAEIKAADAELRVLMPQIIAAISDAFQPVRYPAAVIYKPNDENDLHE